jgi:hypothetical protein
LILQVHCEFFTASQTCFAACFGRKGHRCSSSHRDLLLNVRDFTGRMHSGLVR